MGDGVEKLLKGMEVVIKLKGSAVLPSSTT